MTGAPARIDGRNARRQRTRARIVDAIFALVRAGDVAPTARRIAARAGVSERTLFQHFADLEDLHSAAAARNLEHLAARHRPVAPALAFPARLDAFVRQRAAVLEDLTPLRRAALRHEHASPALQESRRRWARLAREELRRTFTAELAAADDPRATLAAAEALGSWACWDELRTVGRLGLREAARTMAVALARLLVPDAAAPRRRPAARAPAHARVTAR